MLHKAEKLSKKMLHQTELNEIRCYIRQRSSVRKCYIRKRLNKMLKDKDTTEGRSPGHSYNPLNDKVM